MTSKGNWLGPGLQLGLGVLLVLCGGVAVYVALSAQSEPNIGSGWGGALGIAVLFPGFIVLMIGAAIIRVTVLKFVTRVQLSDSGLRISWLHRSREIPWDTLEKLQVTDAGVKLWTEDRERLELPASLSDFEELRRVTSEYAQSHGL